MIGSSVNFSPASSQTTEKYIVLPPHYDFYDVTRWSEFFSSIISLWDQHHMCGLSLIKKHWLLCGAQLYWTINTWCLAMHWGKFDFPILLLTSTTKPQGLLICFWAIICATFKKYYIVRKMENRIRYWPIGNRLIDLPFKSLCSLFSILLSKYTSIDSGLYNF